MKRSIGIGLAAILAVAALVPAALSQGKAPKLDAKQIQKGMADVPAPEVPSPRIRTCSSPGRVPSGCAATRCGRSRARCPASGMVVATIA